MAGGESRFLQPLIDRFGATELDKIDQEAADAAAAEIYPGCAQSTISRQIYTPLTAVINKSAEHKLCAPIKFKRGKPPKPRVRWITHAEAARLIASASFELRPLIAFLLYTGARAGEALWIDWRFVDLDRAQVQFLDTKNGTDRGVPLHPALVAILRELPHRTGEVFRKRGPKLRDANGRFSRDPRTGEWRRALGEPYAYLDEEDDRDVSAGSRIKKGFAGACVRAEIADFHPHDCRHTWATWHYMKNRDLNLLKELGGWSSLEMVLRYAHVNVEHAAPSIAAMPAIEITPPASVAAVEALRVQAEQEAATPKGAFEILAENLQRGLVG
jgi:integrase